VVPPRTANDKPRPPGDQRLPERDDGKGSVAQAYDPAAGLRSGGDLDGPTGLAVRPARDPAHGRAPALGVRPAVSRVSGWSALPANLGWSSIRRTSNNRSREDPSLRDRMRCVPLGMILAGIATVLWGIAEPLALMVESPS
jgi:hypothetical protein